MKFYVTNYEKKKKGEQPLYLWSFSFPRTEPGSSAYTAKTSQSQRWLIFDEFYHLCLLLKTHLMLTSWCDITSCLVLVWEDMGHSVPAQLAIKRWIQVTWEGSWTLCQTHYCPVTWPDTRQVMAGQEMKSHKMNKAEERKGGMGKKTNFFSISSID